MRKEVVGVDEKTIRCRESGGQLLGVGDLGPWHVPLRCPRDPCNQGSVYTLSAEGGWGRESLGSRRRIRRA